MLAAALLAAPAAFAQEEDADSIISAATDAYTSMTLADQARERAARRRRA